MTVDETLDQILKELSSVQDRMLVLEREFVGFRAALGAMIDKYYVISEELRKRGAGDSPLPIGDIGKE